MDDQRRRANLLMAAARGGDRQAFGELAECLGPVVLRFCLAHLPPYLRDAADDAAQDCLLRAWTARERFLPDGDVLAWLLGIALNVVREKRRQRWPGVPLEKLDLPAPPPPERDERLDNLAEAVESLPERQREAVVCRFLRGMSVAETAEAMGCAEGTVKASVFKAMANLQKYFGERT